MATCPPVDIQFSVWALIENSSTYAMRQPDACMHVQCITIYKQIQTIVCECTLYNYYGWMTSHIDA